MSQTKIKITVSGVLELLAQGNDRDAIAKHYGITKSDCKKLFQHPSLKGRKVKKVVEPAFVLVDDLITDAVDEVDEVTIPAESDGDNTEDEATNNEPEDSQEEEVSTASPASAWE